MEQFKFTPGNWQFLFGHTPESVEELVVPSHASHDGRSWKFKEIKIGDEHNRVIATIGARTTNDGVSNEEFAANSKLIVSAPDLLHACIEAQKHLFIQGYGPLDPVYACLINAIENATV